MIGRCVGRQKERERDLGILVRIFSYALFVVPAGFHPNLRLAPLLIVVSGFEREKVSEGTVIKLK
jgi:hypothetical protein